LLGELASAPRAAGGSPVLPAAVASLHHDLEPPLASEEAIGPGGKPSGTVAEHLDTARRAALALLEAAAEGDARGAPYRAVALVLEVGPGFFRREGHLAF